MLSNTNSFIYTKLNDFKYCYVMLIIRFNILLFSHSLTISSIENDEIFLFDQQMRLTSSTTPC